MNSETVILVTRSGSEGADLCRSLERSGLRALHFSPVLLTGPENPAGCQRELSALLPCDRLIAPSAEALRQAVSLVGIDRLRDLPLFVPGRGTGEVATSLGFERVFHPPKGHTSENILDLPALSQVQGLSVVILAAKGGRQAMDRELTKRGARVSRLHVYQRRPATPPSDLDKNLLGFSSTITLLASGGALNALESALSGAAWSHLASGLMIAPSLRVATLARAAGVERVEVARGADHGSMLTALAGARRDLGVCVTLDINPT